MNLFKEHCPQCKQALKVQSASFTKAVIIKECPDQHYRKEFHPALETYIETYRIS